MMIIAVIAIMLGGSYAALQVNQTCPYEEPKEEPIKLRIQFENGEVFEGYLVKD